VEFETTVNPVTAMRITRAIDAAEDEGDALVLIRLDTPGGVVTSMETIVKRMLAADVPVVTWVGPAGAHAASAGFFILIASDVAAMAPGTRTGAASTIFGSGEGSEDNVLLKKMNEDSAALLRSIAHRRGRNVEASEETVFSAKAYEEKAALELGLIDLIAADRDELLARLDGREVTLFDGTAVTLHTEGARIVETEFGFKHAFMEFLGNPTLAYLLLSVGLLGIYIEITHPGVILPGVVGAICLLLFAIAAQALPISSIGVMLILLAAVLFLLEIKVTSFGMLTVGGLFCLVVGSLMLVDGPIPELRVPIEVVLPTSLVVAALCAFVVRLVLRAHRARVGTGIEGLAGEIGTVTQALAPEGKVFVHGEIWNAAAASGKIGAGVRVRVLAVEDSRLTVEAADAASPREEST
jgi:membrane-bound serine protease (ClpP class)